MLKYYATIPNYGQTHKLPFGGSREPYGYLQFILDFWDNLPNVMIFSQDDCLARGCYWGMVNAFSSAAEPLAKLAKRP